MDNTISDSLHDPVFFTISSVSISKLVYQYVAMSIYGTSGDHDHQYVHLSFVFEMGIACQ